MPAFNFRIDVHGGKKYLLNTCKQCETKRTLEYRQENKERYNWLKREKYKNDPDYKARRRLAQQKYYSDPENREKRRIWNREYRAKKKNNQ